MKEITRKIFLLSMAALIFLTGISIGRDLQIKENKLSKELVSEEQYYIDTVGKQVVAETQEVTVYLLGITTDGIRFLVDNRGGSKLNDITIENLVVDDRFMQSYTNISGIRAGTKAYCTVLFYEPFYFDKQTLHLSGNLLIRGANSNLTGKMNLMAGTFMVG